jgi:hypothetical protein
LQAAQQDEGSRVLHDVPFQLRELSAPDIAHLGDDEAGRFVRRASDVLNGRMDSRGKFGVRGKTTSVSFRVASTNLRR